MLAHASVGSVSYAYDFLKLLPGSWVIHRAKDEHWLYYSVRIKEIHIVLGYVSWFYLSL